MTYHHIREAGELPPPPLRSDQLRLFAVDMNPYCHRVLLVLEAKRLKFEICKLNPHQLPVWFKARNPRLKIPVLETPTNYGDKYIFESIVISDYLDERYPQNPLHSRDAFTKAQDRLLIERFNDVIRGSLDCFDTKFEFGSEQIIQTMDVFEKELATRGTNYFGGSRPGMLDYMIWPWIERLYLLRCMDERKFNAKLNIFPNLAEWGDLMQMLDVVKRHSHSPAEYFDYYKNASKHSMI